MRKPLVLILALFWLTNLGLAQQLPHPIICISPDDVVQDSIHQFQMSSPTNTFVVRWTYSEAGANKMLAFWEANEGKKVRTVVGTYETPPTTITFRPIPAVFTNYTQWKQGWLKRRTDKIFGVIEDDAKAIADGLKRK